MFIFNFIKNLNKRRKNFRKKNKEILRKKTIIKSIKNSSVGTNYSTFYDTNNALSKLCEKYGTDKGFVEFKKKTPYGWMPHSYSLYYNSLFFHCRKNIKLVFECGIGSNNLDITSNMTAHGRPGASLRVWREYFDKAQIIGADIDKTILFKEDRISTYKVNQLDPSSIKNMWSEIKHNNFDIIIDDGLHTLEAGLTFFLHSFEKLKEGGIYIIEDVDFSYLNELKDELIKYNPEIVILNNNFSNKSFLKYDNLSNNNLIIVRKL